jgi:RNA polymerase sigma-70 factor, ECF subfamily
MGIEGEIEGSFRREAGRLTASLAAAFGPNNLELAEDVVQETFVRAMRQWSARGIPAIPGAWLGRVAKNLAIDALRRNRIYAPADALEHLTAPASEAALMDDELKMLFLCAHPSLPEESQIALVLKTLCGFGVGEIARALLSTEDAVARRRRRCEGRASRLQAIWGLRFGCSI